MANYRAIATGNWSNGATWAGGAVPPNGAAHNIYSNNFTVTIDTNVNVALITNAAISVSFVGGGTSAAVGGGFVASNGITLTSNVTQGGTYGVAVGNGVCTLPTVNVTVREDFVPATPSAIAINDTVCSGISSVAVSVTNDTTSTIYNWTVPAGWNITFGNITNAIQVTTGTDGGTIEVTAENY
jgi:hypothetical protein